MMGLKPCFRPGVKGTLAAGSAHDGMVRRLHFPEVTAMLRRKASRQNPKMAGHWPGTIHTNS